MSVPVIITFNENLISIADIPFPAVTICHQVKSERQRFDYDKYYNIVYADNRIDDMAHRKTFETISQMCLKDMSKRKIHRIVNNCDSEIDIEEVVDLSPKFKKTILQCGSFMSRDYWRCTDIFSEILIEEGFCHTFNLLHRDELLFNGT